MITCIRDVRKAKRLTLQDVAERCKPPTTPQTIGRLETGTRTVSVGWLNRIAAALDVPAADLVRLPERTDVPVAAYLRANRAHAPRGPAVVAPPRPGPGQIGIIVEEATGDYRPGDEIWCDRIAPPDFRSALGRDILIPRAAGRFLFGRLVGREEGMLHLIPPGAGDRAQVIADPPWAAVAVKLVRTLAASAGSASGAGGETLPDAGASRL